MVTYTTGKNLALVANSSYVGTWDTPTNSNWGIVDAALGQTATIPLNNSNIVLSPAQFQCGIITFTSTLTASVVITFPTSYVGTYTIQNLCTGSSAYVIQLITALATAVIACKPAEPFDVINDGYNLKYKNLGHIGSYWDYAGVAVPLWVSNCTVPPYLHCTGSGFSSATYPALATILGGTTLPDSRGRTRFAFNSGFPRITNVAGYGIDGNTLFAGGGQQTLDQVQFPNVAWPVTDLGHIHNMLNIYDNSGATPYPTGGGTAINLNSKPTELALTGITVRSGGLGYNALPPGYVGGITMIRAA